MQTVVFFQCRGFVGFQLWLSSFDFAMFFKHTHCHAFILKADRPKKHVQHLESGRRVSHSTIIMRFFFFLRFCSLSLSLQFLTFCMHLEPLPSCALMLCGSIYQSPMTVLWRGRSQPRPLCVSQGIYPQQGSSALFLLTHFTSWPRPSPFPHAHRNFCSFILASSQNISEHAGGGALLPDSITTKSDNFFLTFASSLLCDVCLREKLPLCPFNLWVLRASLKGGKCLSLIPFKYVDQISPPQWDL